MNGKNGPSRAVGYVRISVDRDDETSTGTQAERVRAYCTAQGWDVVDVVVEAGRSAYKASRTSRPGYRRVMDLVTTGAADAVVVWKIDRMCRDTEDTLAFVRELAGHNARFVSVTEQFDTSTATGEMTMTVLAALARLESATKSERVQAWQEHRRTTGATPTGPRPFGYRRGGPDRPNVLVIDDDEADVIRAAAKRVIAGDSLRTIVADLEADRIVGKNGTPISRRALRAILTGPTIAGCRETTPGVFVASDGWEAIVDRTTWDEVRAILLDPARRSGPGSTRRWLLSGIAVCGRCTDESSPMLAKPHAAGTRYSCPACHLSIEAERTDALVVADLLAMLDPKAWRRLRHGRPAAVADTAGFEQAMVEVTARFVAGDIDAAELAALADGLRRQQDVASTPSVPLPDVADLGKAWPRLAVEQRRLVLSAATESLVIRPWTPGTNRFDEGRVVWTPVA